MQDDKDVHGILEALKYTKAEDLKAIQRKFATARSTIIDEAMSGRKRAFFTEEELETLGAAARILDSFKTKITHAKEIRAREEKRREMHLNHCKAQRTKILDQYIQQPGTRDEHREAVLFHLALQEHSGSIGGHRGYFAHGFKYIESDLNRGLETKYDHLTVKHVGINCWRESYHWLEENLWHYDTEPDRDRIEMVMQKYRDEWHDVVMRSFKPFLDRYESALHDEFEHEAAKNREKEAVTRRSGIKVVK